MEQIVEENKVIVLNKTTRTDIFNIDPALIVIDTDFNTRIDYGNMDELMNSIIENGVRVPMRGYKDGDTYHLVDGHRRYKAVLMAIENGHQIIRVPFITERKKAIEDRLFDILTLNDGKSLTPLELGETYKRLVNYGYNFTEIAKNVGKTVKHVSDMVSVASSTKEMKDRLKNGDVSATLLADVKAVVKDDVKAEEIVKTAIKEKGGKITKKDIVEQLPKVKEDVYKASQVIEMLITQRELCAKNVPEEFHNAVMNTELLLT